MTDKYKTYRLADIRQKISNMSVHPLDVLVAGPTGAGKSTTLNTFFREDVAPVGNGTDPKTKDITPYSLHQLCRLWDTPGLGDGVYEDEIHKKRIAEQLKRTCTIGNGSRSCYVIDLVLVIIDGSSRDMGTVYRLLTETILKNIDISRVLLAINQADFALKGRGWNYEENRPEQELLRRLEEQANSVQYRVIDSIKQRMVKPVFYSAKYDFNITKLLDLIIDNIPTDRRTSQFQKRY